MKAKSFLKLTPDFRMVLRYIVFSFLSIGAFQLPELVARFTSHPVHFKTITENPLSLLSEPVFLPPGSYYVSYGLVRAACDALVDGKVSDSNRSQGNGVKSALLIGHEFVSTAGVPLSLSLKCDFQQGFITSLANRPIVLNGSAGKLMQMYRGFTTIIVGVGSTLFLLLASIFVLMLQTEVSNVAGVKELFVFSVTGVFYLISYSQLPRLWLGGGAATILHITCRNCFTAGSLLVLSTYLGKWRGWACSFFFYPVVYLFFDFKLRTFWPFYRANSIVFALATSVFCFALFKKRDHSKQMQLIRMIAVCWSTALWMDTYGFFADVSCYNTPLLMAVTCAVFVFLLMYDRSKLEQLEVGVKRILDIAQREHQPEKILSELSNLLFEFTRFSRVSCYIDDFLLGVNATPHRVLSRIFERGYLKDTAADAQIDLFTKRGTKMKSAIETQTTITGSGKEGGHYIIMPIGKYIIVNLSDDEFVSEYQYQVSLDTLGRLKHGINSIENKMNELGTVGGNMLQKLKSIRKENSFKSEIVGIMLDIHDYSKNCERYDVGEGNNPFARFISAQYLPGLARAVSGIAYPEALEGDLIAFVVFKDTFENDIAYKQSVDLIIKKLLVYMHETGFDCASQMGFEKVHFSIAASCSAVTVTLDEYKARTAGQALTIARRILEASPRESVYVSQEIVNSFDLKEWRVKSERLILVKKDIIQACLIEPKSGSSDAA